MHKAKFFFAGKQTKYTYDYKVIPDMPVKNWEHSKEREISFHLKLRKVFVEELSFELSFVLWK